MFLDADTAEGGYQLAAPEGLTAEKLFDARWAAALRQSEHGGSDLTRTAAKKRAGQEDVDYDSLFDSGTIWGTTFPVAGPTTAKF